MNLPPSRRHKTAGYVDESAVYSLSDSTLRCYNKLPLLQHHSILTFCRSEFASLTHSFKDLAPFPNSSDAVEREPILVDPFLFVL